MPISNLQEKINSVKASLPPEFMVSVVKIDLQQLTSQFMELQVRGEGGVDRIRNIADKDIKPELDNIDGIAGVQIYGGQENSVEVRLNEKACKEYGITINQVRSLLAGNSMERVFAGTVERGRKQPVCKCNIRIYRRQGDRQYYSKKGWPRTFTRM